MKELKREYVDIKDIHHEVEHVMATPEGTNNRERIIDELFHALTKKKRIVA